MCKANRKEDFIRYLDSMYENVREKINTSEPADREQYANIVSNWAKTLFQDPLLNYKRGRQPAPKQDMANESKDDVNRRSVYDGDTIESTAV